jgi:hypothetical protein
MKPEPMKDVPVEAGALTSAVIPLLFMSCA